jgi:hypothetical protein
VRSLSSRYIYPSRTLIAQGDLLELMQNMRVSWRGTTFPLASISPLSQHESALILEADGQKYTWLEANICRSVALWTKG